MKPERITEGKPLEAWRQHLLDAAAYMEVHGHCKGCGTDDAGRVCLIGALAKTEMPIGEFDTYCELVRKQIGCRQIPDWNDRQETTKEMAVNALIGAALS